MCSDRCRSPPLFAETSAWGAEVTSRALEGAAQGLGQSRTQQETPRPTHQGRPWACRPVRSLVSRDPPQEL